MCPTGCFTSSKTHHPPIHKSRPWFMLCHHHPFSRKSDGWLGTRHFLTNQKILLMPLTLHQSLPPSIPTNTGSTCLLPSSWNEATSSLTPRSGNHMSSTPFSQLLSKGWKRKHGPHLLSCLKHSRGCHGSKNKAQPLRFMSSLLPAL